ncbi:hypothetical protein B0J12DRAFT_106716 [Macrophomina phaseolina]|uniref:Endo-1,3(4)-beta-glucanase 1 carbohydrate binding domain-containing protein n=1 Tax=Macrophomina phaseolina TaxID=35725 RepID=A0ABQ8FPA3_9PEZI|nr:hypothetical protein B0J12DRAFT_106716 [Macrophomina phaseolina]
MHFSTLLALATTALASAIDHRQNWAIRGRDTNSSATTNTTTTILYCDSTPYFAGTYVCYNGTTLCPVLNGNATVPCGEACYDPTQYGCQNGVFVQLNITSKT